MRETRRNSISVRGRRAALADFPAAAEHAVDDGIQDRGIDVEDQIAFQRFGLEQVEARRIFQAEHEFAVSELIHAGEFYFDDGSQKCGKMPPPNLRPKPSCMVCRALICSLPTRSGRLKS